MYDCVIIGGGVVGCSIAHYLSKYDVKCLLLEKSEDVASGTTKANSAIVHAGYDAMPGTLKAKLNVRGTQMMPKLSKDLDFPLMMIGSLVVCTDENEKDKLKELYDRGIKNGVKNMSILNRAELVKMEPNISDNAVAALYAKDAGIVCPFNLAIALAENAYENGIEFKFNQKVEKIEKKKSSFIVHTKAIKFNGKKDKDLNIETKTIINAAGIYADEIHNSVCKDKIHITARRGDYLLLDAGTGSHVNSVIFALPSKMGKGILVTPTVHGNLLVGPTAFDIENKEGTNTEASGLKKVMTDSAITVKNIPLRQVITSFAGLRAHEEGDDFIIGESEEVEGFFDASGIESPGLSASPAIGEMVAELVSKKLDLKKNKKFISKRKGIPHMAKMSYDELNKQIKKDPLYGNIVCRCCKVTEGEIVNAIRRPLGATSIDGIKRRTDAGLGRCQAGFCTPNTLKILARELKIDVKDITKKGGESNFVFD